ncbi:MAG: hypothetical protein HKN12_03660 [Gemmatimonadetes bacterium]|nr:hypothetical protein [Gemmatimonadota bacterium]
MNRRIRKATALLSVLLLLIVQAVPAFALCPCEMSAAESCCSAPAEPVGCCAVPEPVAPAGCCAPEASAEPAAPAAASGCCSTAAAPVATLGAGPVAPSQATAIGTPCCERTTFDSDVSAATVPAGSKPGHSKDHAAAAPGVAMIPTTVPSTASVLERGPPGALPAPPSLRHTILLL